MGVEEQRRNGWNKDDKSPNVYVKDDGLTVHRYPVAQSSDGCRGKRGYSRGLHCWKITWAPKQRGTHAIVGVATNEAPLTCPGYRSLVGMTAQSWGWDLKRNRLYHNGKQQQAAANNNNGGHRRQYNEQGGNPIDITVVLDMELGTLSYIVDGKYLGCAFDSGLKGKTLYPVISCVWGNCEIGMKYVGCLKRKFAATTAAATAATAAAVTAAADTAVTATATAAVQFSFVYQ